MFNSTYSNSSFFNGTNSTIPGNTTFFSSMNAATVRRYRSPTPAPTVRSYDDSGVSASTTFLICLGLCIFVGGLMYGLYSDDDEPTNNQRPSDTAVELGTNPALDQGYELNRLNSEAQYDSSSSTSYSGDYEDNNSGETALTETDEADPDEANENQDDTTASFSARLG